jgi:hypothetical protein
VTAARIAALQFTLKEHDFISQSAIRNSANGSLISTYRAYRNTHVFRALFYF